MNRYHVLTLFPEMIENGLKTSITGRAIENGTIGLNAINIRDFADNKHNKVDDYPYGGGAGITLNKYQLINYYKNPNSGFLESTNISFSLNKFH